VSERHGGVSAPLVRVDDLHLVYQSGQKTAYAIQGANLTILDDQVVGLVGESGSGKSSLVRAIIGLLPQRQARIVHGTIEIAGRDVTSLAQHDWPSLRGNVVTMVFQDSLSFLNPVMRVEAQIGEAVRRHNSQIKVRQRVRELVDLVRLPARTLRSYAFELSGGMRQRVAIACALACRPRLLIADEPTTALDVTTQAEILALLAELRVSQGMALLLISHDLGIVRWLCEELYIMYAGRMVEWGPTSALFAQPAHPYLSGLLDAARTLRGQDGRFAAIKGEVPDLKALITACPFAPRCQHRMVVCDQMPPAFDVGDTGTHGTRCWLHGGNVSNAEASL
jgi:oligopeptide/dipeptide ABC transporter ATP-binding protein